MSEEDKDEFKRQPMPMFLERFVRAGSRDATMDDVMIYALAALNMSSFEELLNRSGPVEALRALRPYRKQEMQFAIIGIQKGMNLQGNGVDVMLLTYLMAGAFGVSLDKMKGEIKERGGVGTFHDCLFKDGLPEHCMSISHYCLEHLTESINPEYESYWTHHQSSGDPFCRFVFKKRSDPIAVLEDLGGTLVTLPRFELSREQCQCQSVMTLMSFLNDDVRAFVDLHGSEKTLGVLSPVGYGIGQEIGHKLVGQPARNRTDANSLGEMVRAMQRTYGQNTNYSVISRDMVENEITDCLAQNFSPYEACRQKEALFQGIVDAIDPDYEFLYDRMKTRGDANCHWVIRKRANQRPKVDAQNIVRI